MTCSRTSSLVTYLIGAIMCVALTVVAVSTVPWVAAATGGAERVSANASHNQGDSESRAPSISADGRYVAFASLAGNLVPQDTNGEYDVFVCDRQTGEVKRVSVGSAGAQANGTSGSPSISADGRRVAFLSRATNLVANDTNSKWDVFVHTLATGVTERVSVSTEGVESDADCTRLAIDGDGSVVCFSTQGTNLVLGTRTGW